MFCRGFSVPLLDVVYWVFRWSREGTMEFHKTNYRETAARIEAEVRPCEDYLYLPASRYMEDEVKRLGYIHAGEGMVS